MAKGKLRHIAISVPDKEKAAKFYEETFGFERVSHSRVATRLSDAVMNITLLQFETQEDAGDERGRAGECRTQVPRSIWHRFRYFDSWLGWSAEVRRTSLCLKSVPISY
jgi:catechol 2,3-dioxygenase-like lactoylglutathione lyase family enzyme